MPNHSTVQFKKVSITPDAWQAEKGMIVMCLPMHDAQGVEVADHLHNCPCHESRIQLAAKHNLSVEEGLDITDVVGLVCFGPSGHLTGSPVIARKIDYDWSTQCKVAAPINRHLLFTSWKLCQLHVNFEDTKFECAILVTSSGRQTR